MASFASNFKWLSWCHGAVLARLDRKKEKDGRDRADLALGEQTPNAGYIWDLTNSIVFACWKSDGHAERLPCLLRGHRLWHTEKKSNLSDSVVSVWRKVQN